MQRVSFAPAANRVAPVVVGAQPAAASRVPNAARNRPTAAAAAATAAAQPTPTQPPAPSGQQDGESVRAAALAYLQQQSAGLPGRVNITVSPVFPRGLAACTSLEPFMPPGARTWGRTTVGVRCVGEHPWTLYVQARVAVQVTYYTAARPIGPGDTLSATDLQPRDGDLASLPQTVITDPSQALGAVSLERIAAGLPLRTDMLRSASSVVIGQTVRIVAAGPNFTISTEGSALNNAAPGQRVQVRARNGQIISGVVKDAGTVQVQI
jgi:flagella basal body P-ring formation protein FlgA